MITTSSSPQRLRPKQLWTRVVSALLFALAAIASGACARQDGPPPPPMYRGGYQGGYQGGSCGVRVFESPTCERALDYTCCIQKLNCAQDAVCNRLADCFFHCKHRGDACLSACYLREPPSPAMQIAQSKLGAIYKCSEHAFFSQNERCGDDS